VLLVSVGVTIVILKFDETRDKNMNYVMRSNVCVHVHMCAFFILFFLNFCKVTMDFCLK